MTFRRQSAGSVRAPHRTLRPDTESPLEVDGPTGLISHRIDGTPGPASADPFPIGYAVLSPAPVRLDCGTSDPVKPHRGFCYALFKATQEYVSGK